MRPRARVSPLAQVRRPRVTAPGTAHGQRLLGRVPAHGSICRGRALWPGTERCRLVEASPEPLRPPAQQCPPRTLDGLAAASDDVGVRARRQTAQPLLAGSTNMISSPPYRKAMSVERNTLRTLCPKVARLSSPTWCPFESLTALKPSRSMRTTASPASVRSRTRTSSPRLASPVRGSVAAAWSRPLTRTSSDAFLRAIPCPIRSPDTDRDQHLHPDLVR